MNEELRIIMETIGQLGQAGKEAFIWWLVVKYLMQYVALLIGVGIGAFVVLGVAKRIKEHHKECFITDAVALKCGIDTTSWYRSGDYSKMLEWVRNAENKEAM